MKKNGIMVHHSKSSFGTMKWLDDVHRNHRSVKFREIGYDVVIRNGYDHSDGVYNSETDGLVELGRSVDSRGAHCLGKDPDTGEDYNSSYIGIVVIGPTDEYQLTENQFDALVEVCAKLIHAGPFTVERVKGHNEADPRTQCPGGIDMDEVRAEISYLLPLMEDDEL